MTCIDHPWTVSSASYAKGKLLVRPTDGAGGFKGRASYLVEHLGGRWTHRERAYVMSPAAVGKLAALFDAGFTARNAVPPWIPTSRLFHPDGQEMTTRDALRSLKRIEPGDFVVYRDGRHNGSSFKVRKVLPRGRIAVSSGGETNVDRDGYYLDSVEIDGRDVHRAPRRGAA